MEKPPSLSVWPGTYLAPFLPLIKIWSSLTQALIAFATRPLTFHPSFVSFLSAKNKRERESKEGGGVVLLVVVVAGEEGLGGLPVPSGPASFCGL